MSCGVSRRCDLNLVLLWLRCRLAAVAPIRPLAWDSPYAAGVALKSKAKKKKLYTTYVGKKITAGGEGGSGCWRRRTVELPSSQIYHKYTCKCWEFPLWLGGLGTQHSVHEDADLIPGLTQWVRIWHCHELWCRSRCSSDPALPWLWRSLAAAAPI